MSSLWPLILLVGVVGVLTTAATALRTVSRIWLRHWAEQRLAGAGTAALYLERPQRLLIAAGAGIAGTVYTLGAVLGLQQGDRGFSLAQTLVVAAAMLLVFGQLVPRAIARRWPAESLPVVLPLLRVVEGLTQPLARVAMRLVSRWAGPSAAAPETPGDVLEDLLREGELEGVGAAEEREIISGVVEFGDTRVSAVMTARADIVAVERTARADHVAQLVAQSKYSRLPIYDGTIDHVVGMVTSWDVIARPEAPLRAPRPVAVATPDEPCHALMTRMLRDRRHLAIVRGAAGETLGLVTLEDLVEEFVGEIQDEHDDPVTDA
ncbi:CNNM domain-containing protein [Pseudogemmatithrix spongiicola]|uniref:CNNM domain-containing protein n=1 Tax=Pseudogemmatithrix spongiicola TaxID=3062599 RepID=A0AA49Q7Y5_9BACT|nr:CNNM domain-containing protein [Gemmatimonadaceae bacterium 'strain 138']WKW15209.1 CNNM domain-containing protein [Gemmatimonadaceae bacterium 'strain 318']